MTTETHFVQGGDEPVLIGSGAGTLSCKCGSTLITGFSPERFLAIGIQCARCATVTTTEGLPEGELPPRSAIIAAPSDEPRMTAMTVPPNVPVVGQAEMARLQARFQPATPDSSYHVSPALLDDAVAAFERHTGGTLPVVVLGDLDDAFAGLDQHALAWSIRHLRARTESEDWSCMESVPTASAVTHVTGFLHFVATWSHHPLFPAMLQTAGADGFSLHGLALFAAAHCMTLMGNRISFPEPLGYPNRIEGFSMVAEADPVAVHLEVFDRFEIPFGHPWDAASLRTAVSDLMEAMQGRINLRNPGVLVISPGSALPGFDEALIEAVKASMQALGRKNRGLMAVAPVVLRLQPLPDPHAVRFGYGFFPIVNRHFRADGAMQIDG
jgi:hypothetical protein